MIRWRYSLVLATVLLLLLPSRTSCKGDDEDEEERNEDQDEDEDEDEEEEEEDGGDHDRPSSASPGVPRAPPGIESMVSPPNLAMTRTSKKRPLECYVCAYKAETPLKACLDPTRFRVHTITCHSVDDKCFTTVISKGDTGYEAVVRGCRSGCVGSPDTNCCELNRCNNQAFAMPSPPPIALATADVAKHSKADTPAAPNVLYFVTLLLLLQTAARVAFVLPAA